MLIRNGDNQVFRSRGPLKLPRRRALAAAPVQGLYMRPNGNSDGSVPAQGPYCVCPDIWVAGQNAIDPATLTTAASYAQGSQNNVRSGMQNLIYVRGKNGASSSKTCTVTLYYSPSGVILSPSNWERNVIPTDKGAPNGNITGAQGAIAVCDSTFNWLNPDPPPPGSDHYCLLAQFNDAQNSNPLPNPENVFDLTALITNNLGWGWRNVSMIIAAPTWSLSEPLTIPANWPTSPPGAWQVQIIPTGFLNWDVELECSELDSSGKAIAFPRTKITNSGPGFLIPGLTLDPGWSASVSVSLYSPDGSLPQSGWGVHIQPINIQTTPPARREAVGRNLVDPAFMARMRACYPQVYSGPELALVPGGYQGTVAAAAPT